jgi:hypothetical protein
MQFEGLVGQGWWVGVLNPDILRISKTRGF